MINFASLEFLFRFLPIFLMIYFLIPAKYKDTALLLGSLIFYGMGEPLFLPLLVVATAANYLLGRKIWKLQSGNKIHKWQKKERKKYMIVAVVFDVLLLVVFKALGTFVDNKLLPLGISFYVFKMISYQVDMMKAEVRNRPGFKDTALYFCMFPQVVSGPIMRYNDGDFDLDRVCRLEDFEDGLKYFVLGLGMKVLLADRLAILWSDLQMIGFESISTPLAWMGAAGFSLQLYFDFWGYSLMSSGLLVMMGYSFVENFDHPYAAKSVSEFYRRWHMTLGSWFRDYVYIPLGGSRCSKGRLFRNLALVWLLTGLWHGNGLNFILWGVVLGVFVILEKLVYGKCLQKIPLLGHIYVLAVIPLTWVIFAAPDVRQLGIYFGRLFPFIGGEGIAVNTRDFIKYGQDYGVFLLAGVLLCVPAVYTFFERNKKNPVVILFLTVIFWLSVYLISCSAGNPFMYLKF
ncbi:MAG: MBOAT family protein [Lachnospiraceae bacterium]|nr:MBOAT family protein [Lachnospiraceae bacterium]